jgi:SAM-dependent methyltransferase
MFSVEHLNTLRKAEMERILSVLPPAGRLLEIGAGTGQQAALLAAHGYAVEAIELAGSNYSADRIFPITDYDGRSIPFPDASFDIVFSSNVLEHVPDLAAMHREIRRVLAPGGLAVHVLPTHSWRFWSTVSSVPDSLLYALTLRRQLRPPRHVNKESLGYWWDAWKQAGRHLRRPFEQGRHGERGNVISETWLFHPSWWRRNFAENGFRIVEERPMGLFYTGNMVLGPRWSLARRAKLARVLGSACHVFKLAPA